MNINSNTKIYVALPVINELDNIHSFINDIKAQTFTNYELFVCVNQPDNWWEDVFADKLSICKNNQSVINILKEELTINIHIIDKSSKGLGWKGKQSGVGWARKVLMDAINEVADKNDIIVSLDADTRFNNTYLQSIVNIFKKHPKAVAISNPYYHRLTDDDNTNRAILRYEIYMRHYAINLWRIACPYDFTALGSALSLPVWAYRKIGGISPMKSGEDFYFLQKLSKSGKVINYNQEKVYPEARFSDRVFFGTGPAMIKGNNGDWQSYPIYHFTLFNNIKDTYSLFPKLYKEDVELPLSAFLAEQFNNDKWWVALRKNFKTEHHFVKACYEKVDGLRILQYLKSNQHTIEKTDEECLKDFIITFYNDFIKEINVNFDTFNFDDLTTMQLNEIRNVLVSIEEAIQASNYNSLK